ncbi:RBR-type E3 ubiquitin transferase [Ranunculus cassubicifolius]
MASNLEDEGQEIFGDEFTSNLKSSRDPKADELDDIMSILEKLSLAAEEPDLSVDQFKINMQSQEDELLALEAIYGEYLKVLPSEGNHSFQINVHIEGLEEFTISAKDYSFRVAHLPPIVLTCRLPASYPSHQPPYFTISSQWLDTIKLSKLCCMLDSLWTNQPGQEIVFQWADWLQTSSLSFIGFEKEIVIGDLESLSNAGDEDSRAVSGSVSPNVDIVSMMNYNEDRCHAIFLGDLHRCCICFSERAGTEFMRLPCKHFFCLKCMETYSSIHIKEGSVDKLVCPNAKCGGMVPPFLLKSLLGNEQFDRWESLLLRKTLASMSDIFSCPRCETTSIADGENQAKCPSCLFSFCSICQQKVHVGTPCVIPELKLKTLEERHGSFQYIEDPLKRIKDPLKELKQIMERKRRERLNYLLSIKELKRDAQQCPKCKTWIQKNGGCDHMRCSCCGTQFIYRNCSADFLVLFGTVGLELWEGFESLIRHASRCYQHKKHRDV